MPLVVVTAIASDRSYGRCKWPQRCAACCLWTGCRPRTSRTTSCLARSIGGRTPTNAPPSVAPTSRSCTVRPGPTCSQRRCRRTGTCASPLECPVAVASVWPTVPLRRSKAALARSTVSSSDPPLHSGSRCTPRACSSLAPRCRTSACTSVWATLPTAPCWARPQALRRASETTAARLPRRPSRSRASVARRRATRSSSPLTTRRSRRRWLRATRR